MRSRWAPQQAEDETAPRGAAAWARVRATTPPRAKAMIRFIAEQWSAYLAGFGTAIFISVIAMGGSIVIGTLGAIGRMSGFRSVRAISSAYVAIFRGLPPLLALYLVYFGLPSWSASAEIGLLSQLLEPLGNRIFAAVFAFTLVSGAYCTEIMRAAIQAVPEEQTEAAQSIGMSYGLAFRRVIAPQAFRIAFPPLGNEYIALLKATSLASVIGVTELMRTAQIAANQTFQHLLAYSMAGIYYAVFVISLQLVLQTISRWTRSGPAMSRAPGS
jgi:His/Glu/Gln/Arg/opine family amino acid ABC transporter permease subunit